MLDEVDQFLSIDIVQCKIFINILSWWSIRMKILPSHYQMAIDYLGTPMRSTSSKRVNNVLGRKFTSSVDSPVFIMIMCLRSCVDAKIIKVSANRAVDATMEYANKGHPTY